MTYLFVYRAGPVPLTPEQLAESRALWPAWNEMLRETYGIRTARGKIVSSQCVTDYEGNLKGMSCVELGSLEEAVALAQRSPTVRFGGSVEVLEEFQR